jgi:fructose-1,6-bisphosphatase/inositol monophosphatase family enzyme
MFTLSRQVLQDVSEILLKADREIIIPALTGKRAEVKQKGEVYGEGDFVTSIDENCENFLLDAFRKFLPDSFAVGEESFDTEREKNIAALSKGYAWILDPLDGTNNVKKYLTDESDDLPRYGVMAALLYQGKPVAGWVLSCYRDEKKLACGADDLGAFFYDVSAKTLQPMKLSAPTKTVEKLSLVTTIKAFPADYQVIINANVAAGKVTIFDPPPKSAAHEIMFMLDGTADAAPFRQFRLWDHMPGMVIVRAAGGHVQLMNGEEPTLADQRLNGILYAPNKASWRQIRQNFLGDIFYDHTT